MTQSRFRARIPTGWPEPVGQSHMSARSSPARVCGTLIPSTVAPGAQTRVPGRLPSAAQRSSNLAKTPRGWTGARTPSAIKRVRQAERRRAINQPRKSAAKTYAANAMQVATGASEGDAATALAEAMSALDRAAKVGAIHPNNAARRKSRLAIKLNALANGTAVPTTAH